MSKKIAINGFGRIGRLVFRQMFADSDFEIVAINDLTSPKTLAHLLKYDSNQGNYKKDSITATENSIKVDGKEIRIYAERNPKDLPWGDLGVDFVVESTGFFVSDTAAQAHIDAGAKKVLISAPATGDLKTIVYNVNHDSLDGSETFISGASCTTNCLAPVAQVLEDNFGVEKGLMNTIHAYTNDQQTLDGPHSDLRRARNAATNIIPTSTGAAAAVGKVLPALVGKLDGVAVRVPVQTGSVVYLYVELKSNPTVDEINAKFKAAANDTLYYNEDLIVSSDVIGTTYGSLFDSTQTTLIEQNGKKLYQIVSWYDNENSFVSQFVRTAKHLGKIS